jgi:ABC-type Zn uptake system ZnuABC Zn-binding protein ZnuA
MVLRVILLLILSFALFLVGCERAPVTAPDARVSDKEPVHVLATVYVLADIARQVGGDQVEVSWFVESGQSLKELVETPERRNLFRVADIMVTRGAADPWTLEGVGNAFQDRKILRIDGLPSTREQDPSGYVWLDPRTAIEVTDELTTRLCTLKPKRESAFRANAETFKRRVADLMDQTSSVINRAGGGPFITMDRGFLPLAKRFGLSEVRPPAFPVAQASEYDIKRLRQTADGAGAGAIFLSSETPTPLRRDLEERLGLAVLTLDALGTSAPTGRSTYLAVLRYNLEQLQAGAARSRPGLTLPPTGDARAGDAQPAQQPDAPILPQPALRPSPATRDSGTRRMPSPANPFEPVR